MLAKFRGYYINTSFAHQQARISDDFENYNNIRKLKLYAENNVVDYKAVRIVNKIKSSDWSVLINKLKVLEDNYLNPNAGRLKNKLIKH